MVVFYSGAGQGRACTKNNSSCKLLANLDSEQKKQQLL